MRPLAQYISALPYPLRAVGFILRHPSLWPYCLIPLIINVVVLWLAWRWTGSVADQWLATHLQESGWVWQSLRWATGALLIVARVIITLILMVVIGNAAAVPFNDFLSERVDVLLGWRDERNLPFGRKLAELAITVLQELKRISLFLAISAALLIMSFTGALAPLAAPLQLLVAAEFFALDYLSFPLERRGTLLLGQKIAFTREHAARCLGFGTAMAAVGVIPIVNFLFIPLGVVGGTLLHGDIQRMHRARRLR
jgi:CysZ protein